MKPPAPMLATACLAIALASIVPATPASAESQPIAPQPTTTEDQPEGPVVTGTLQGTDPRHGPDGEAEAGSEPGGWSTLDQDGRKKIRAALQNVLANPDVTAARQQVQAASENLKQTLRSAIESENPELGPILRRILAKERAGASAGPLGQHGPGQSGPGRQRPRWMTGIWSSDFPANPVDGLQREIFPRVLEATRRKLKEAHLASRQSPAVQETLEKLMATETVEEKQPLGEKLRKTYIEEMKSRLPGLEKMFEQTDAHRRHPGPQWPLRDLLGPPRPSPEASSPESPEASRKEQAASPEPGG